MPVLVVLDHEDLPGPDLADMDVAKSDASSWGPCTNNCGAFGTDTSRPVPELVGTHPLIGQAKLHRSAAPCAGCPCVGPPGVGKAHAAKAVHYAQRDPGPLVPVSWRWSRPTCCASPMLCLVVQVFDRERMIAHADLEDVDLLSPEAQSDLVSLLWADPLRQVRIIATSCKPRDELVALLSAELARLAPSTITIELPALGASGWKTCRCCASISGGGQRRSGEAAWRIHEPGPGPVAGVSLAGQLGRIGTNRPRVHERARWGEIAAGDLPDRVRWAADAASYPPRVDESIDLEEFLARLERS